MSMGVWIPVRVPASDPLDCPPGREVVGWSGNSVLGVLRSTHVEPWAGPRGQLRVNLYGTIASGPWGPREAPEAWGGLCFCHRHGNCPLSATQSRPQPLKCVVFVLYRCSGEPGCEASVGTRGERSVDSLRGGLPPSSMSPRGGTLGSLWTSAASTTQWSPGRHPQA